VLALTWPARSLAGETVVNGGFETGDFGPSWMHGAYRKNTQNPGLADNVVMPDLPYGGHYSALLGFKYSGQGNASAYMYQDVAIPAGVSGATLRFQYRMQGYDGDFYANFIADVRTTGGAVLANVVTDAFSQFDDKFKDSGWNAVSLDMTAYAGQTVRLYFEQANLNDNNLETWAYVDDVSLEIRRYVDLAVDGDGVGAFGAPGSGLGGGSAQSSVAGDTLSYSLQVINEGPANDTYLLAVSVPPGWAASIDGGSGPQGFPLTTPSIAPSGAMAYTVTLIIPPGAALGWRDAVVDAVSVAQGSRNDSVTLRAGVVDAVYGTDLVVEGNGFGVTGSGGAGGFALGTSTWGVTRAFDVELINTGNHATAYTVDFSAPAGAVTTVTMAGTQRVGPFTTSSVADGESIVMRLDVTIPAPVPGGDYTTILRAAAVGDSLRKDSIKAVTRLQEPRVDLMIVTNGDGIYDDTFSGMGGSSTIAAELGLTVNFPVLVQNESPLADWFTIDWVPPSGGWRAVLEVGGVDHDFPWSTPTLAPFTQATYVLKIEIRNGASFGTYRSFLNAVSQADARVSESVSASISVSNSSEIDMLIDGQGAGLYGPVGTGLGGLSQKSVAAGDTADFEVTILNVSGVDAFDVSWDAPLGWEVALGGFTPPITGLAAGTYTLRVVTPTTASGGTVDVIVDGNKSDKPYLMDSVTGRVDIVPAARVDAVIDGVGDGVFGAPGSGLGGASQQNAPAPASMNFTVELQNEGPEADQYRVSWNSVAGLSAAFAGAATPYVTAPVAAGGSGLFTFTVTVPPGAATGFHDFVIDVVSTSASSSVESIAARVGVFGPPRADLVIDGNGAGVYGVLGSGQGGTSVRAANPGTSYASTLRVRNAGSFADSFRVQWDPPTRWPAGSVTVHAGGVERVAPFWTGVLGAGQFVDCTVTVQVPAGATGAHTTIFNAWSSLPPGLAESVALVTDTRALVRGVVFEDRDQDGVFGGGDAALPGATVVELSSGANAITDAGGAYSFAITAPATVTVSERNPSGFVSITPDTVGPFVVNAGDTVTVDFADLAPLQLTPGGVLAAPAGGFVDFPHRLRAGTPGHVDLTVTNAHGAVTMVMLDADADGVFGGADRTLIPADTDLDPAIGDGAVYLLVRVFIPAGTPAGTTIHVQVDASQVVAGGAALSASAVDAAVVVGDALGQVALHKLSDRIGASPGDVIAYSITFVNTGADSVQNLVVLDPISQWVDLEPDAFGVGLDLRWQAVGAPPVFLTFSPADADECEYSAAERLLRLVFSKNGTFYLAPGESGQLTYRVRVR
jgi:uncharacterized repeat protein (TIGR01451 family)